MHVTYENTSFHPAIPRTLDRVSLGNLLGREVGLKFKPLMGNIQAMNLRKLDLNLLLVFDAIYAEASITRAANRLGLTQPALSNALKRLREHLGDPLFEREGRGVVPTVEAKRLAPAIREALRAIEQAVSIATDFDPPTSARIFSMTLPEALEARLMPPLLNRVTELAPNIQFRLKLFGGNVEQLVLSKEIDFAIFVHPLNKTGINSAYLTRLGGCIAVRADHPVYGARETFTREDLCEAGFAVLDAEVARIGHFAQALAAQGITRHIVCTVPRTWSLPYLVAQTDLVAAMPSYLAEALAPKLGLKLFDMPIEVPAQNSYLLWHEDFDHDPAHQWMRRQIEALFREV
jgi:DNA-binding transcriptional LysR family regulator